MPIKLRLDRRQSAIVLRDKPFVLRCIYLGYTYGVIETFLNSATERTRKEIESDADFLGFTEDYFELELRP